MEYKLFTIVRYNYRDYNMQVYDVGRSQARSRNFKVHRPVSMIVNLEALCSRLITGTGCRACSMTTPGQKVPKHRDNNVCSRIVTSAAWYYKWRWGEPKHTHNNERCTLYRVTERFEAFAHTKLVRKEEKRFKRKIMICHKKHVLLCQKGVQLNLEEER